MAPDLAARLPHSLDDQGFELERVAFRRLEKPTDMAGRDFLRTTDALDDLTNGLFRHRKQVDSNGGGDEVDHIQ